MSLMKYKILKINSQLIDKANKSDVRLKSEKLGQTDMKEEFLQQMAGTTPINAVPARDSVVRSNLSKSSVDLDVLAFTEKPNNLFNKLNTQKGFSISSSTGLLTPNASYYASDFSYIKANTQYSANGIARVLFYDSTLNYISSITATLFTTPSNACFFRCSVIEDNILTAQINEGTVLLSYDNYVYALKSTERYPIKIFPSCKSVGSDSIQEGAVEPISLSIMEKSKNILNKNDVLIDTIIDTNGNLATNTTYVTSDYIRVKPGLTYSKSSGSLVLATYDFQKKLIKRASISSSTANFTVQEDAEFIRLSIVKATYLTMVIAEGVNPIPYEDYKFTLKSTPKFPIDIDKTLLEQPLKVWFSAEDISNYYKATTSLGTQDAGGFSPVASITSYNDFISRWRELASLYPNYITETYLGKDCSGVYDMYRYSLVNDNYDIRVTSDMNTQIKRFPKIVIISGVHGDEKLSAYSLYWLVKDMIENWQTNEALEYLRFNVNFEIIPFVNPSGFMSGYSGARKNANGVDINRNFSQGWKLESDISLPTFGGSQPFSEIEAIYVKNLIESNKDAIAFFDYHMNGSSGTEWNNMFWMGLNKDDYAIKFFPNLIRSSKTTLGKCLRTWKIERNFVVPNDLYSYIEIGASKGTGSNYANSLGVFGCTIECAQKLPTEINSGSGEIISMNKEFVGNFLLNTLRVFKENPLR